MIVCTYEDRPTALIGLKLLVLSLRRCVGDWPVMVFVRNIDVGEARELLGDDGVELRDANDLNSAGWNVKPAILTRMLDEGHGRVLWVDSDIVVAHDFRPLLDAHGDEVFVATQEHRWGMCPGSRLRTGKWGFEAGRELPVTVNSGVMRVSPSHRDLLDRWMELLESNEYAQMQARPWYERPAHLLSDQDVLTALLGSAEFAGVPVHLLRRGRDIAQHHGPSGFSVGERLAVLFKGTPPLVHCQGPKAWDYGPGDTLGRDKRRYYERLYLELSLYSAVAGRYRDEVGLPMDWTRPSAWPARLCHALMLGQPVLRGLPLAVFDTVVKSVRRMVGRTHWDRDGEVVAA